MISLRDLFADNFFTRPQVDKLRRLYTDLVEQIGGGLGLKADKSTTISAGTGLVGGGDLSANRTIALDLGYTDARYPVIGTGGKISATVLPAIAITNTFAVNSQAEMLALVAETGDVAIRTDLNKTFILSADPASTLANWKEMLTPTDSVTSVFGRTGVVTAQANDYTFAQIGSKPTTLAGYGITDAASDSAVVHLAGSETITGAKTFAADVRLNNTYSLMVGSQSGGGVGQVRIEDATAARIGFTTSGSRRYTVGSSGSLWTLRDESGAVDRLSVDSSGVFLFRGGEARVTSLQTQFGYVGVAGYTVSISSTAGGGGTSDLRLNNSPTENRWLLRKNAVVESGSNVGSDLQLYRYLDSGSASVVLDVSRATGVVDFTVAPTCSGSDLALDNSVVHIAGPETITGEKTFSDDPRFYVGAINTQQLLGSYGWNNNIPRWKWVLESSAKWSLYSYDTAGNTPTLALQVGTSITGGETFTFLGNAVWHTGNLPAYSSSPSNSTLVQRTASGYVFANYFNTSSDVTAASPSAVMVETNSDGYIRKQTLTNLRTNMAAVHNVAGVASIYKLTQAAYDAIGTKDANTLYVIVG